jgi:hypothetical protein
MVSETMVMGFMRRAAVLMVVVGAVLPKDTVAQSHPGWCQGVGNKHGSVAVCNPTPDPNLGHSPPQATPTYAVPTTVPQQVAQPMLVPQQVPTPTPQATPQQVPQTVAQPMLVPQQVPTPTPQATPQQVPQTVAQPMLVPQQVPTPTPQVTPQQVPQELPTAIPPLAQQTPTPQIKAGTATPHQTPVFYFKPGPGGQMVQVPTDQIHNEQNRGYVHPNGQLSTYARNHGWVMVTPRVPQQAPGQTPTATPALAPQMLNPPQQVPVKQPSATPGAIPQQVPHLVAQPQQVAQPMLVPQQVPTPTPRATPQQVPPTVAQPMLVPQQVPTPTPQATPQQVPPKVPQPIEQREPQLATQRPVPLTTAPELIVTGRPGGNSIVHVTGAGNTTWTLGPVTATPGRQKHHALPSYMAADGTVVQCLAGGFGWRYVEDETGDLRLVGRTPVLRATDLIVRDVPANQMMQPDCVVLVQRRFDGGPLEMP